MKYIKGMFIFIITFIILPISVKADCGSSFYNNYYAQVNNTNGAATYKNQEDNKYYKTSFSIPYNTVVEIKYDLQKLNDDYLYLIRYQNEEYIVKASDLKNTEPLKNTNEKLEKSDYYTIYDTEVRSGPGVLYDIVGTIKADTNVLINHEPLDSMESSEGAWIKISDGNISGYIYYDSCFAVLPVNIGKKSENTDFYWVGSNDNKYNFKYGEKVQVKYITNFSHGSKYYFYKNGKMYQDEYLTLGISTDENIMFINTSTLDIYNTSNQKVLNLNDKIQLNKLYKIDYIAYLDNDINYYFTINNEKYYVSLSDYYDYRSSENNSIFDFIIVSKKETINFSENMYYGFNIFQNYKIMNKNEKIEGYKVLNDLLIEDIYYNSDLGFFHKMSDHKNLKNENTYISDDESKDENTYISKDEDQNENPEETNQEVLEVSGLSAEEYVKKCLIGSIILSIASLIGIIVINKNCKHM